MSRQTIPQYNPNPNIPVGFIGSDTNQPQMQPQMQRQPQMQSQMQQQMHRQPQMQPQMQQQPMKRHILFFQPSCQHSQEFLKLLNFSKNMTNRFIQINVLTPNQKIPDKVQVTPTIFTVPDYNMYAADDAFKWLQQEGK